MKIWILFIASFLTSTQFVGAQQNEKELLALEYMSAGEYDKASVLYGEIYAKNSSAYIYDNYLECLIQLKNWKEAEKLTQKQKKNQPAIARYHVDEGYIYYLQDNLKQADKIFNSAILWAVSSEVLILDLSDAFQSRELNDWATRTLQQGKKSFPSSGQMSVHLARVYYKVRSYEEMIDEYLSLLERPLFGLDGVQKLLQSFIIEDSEGTISGIFLQKMLERVQKNPQSFDDNRLLIWYYEQKGEFSKAFVQARAYDKRSKNDGDMSYEVAQTCIAARNWSLAEDALTFVVSLGDEKALCDDARDLLLEVKYQKLTDNPSSDKSEFVSLSADLKNAVRNTGFRRNRYNLLMRLAFVEAYFLQEPDSAIQHLNEIILNPGYLPVQVAEAKLLQGDVMLIKGDVWEGSLLYSQVEKAFKNDTIGFYAKFRNARLYYFLGEFDYASAQLEILSGATSKLIANDAMELSLLIQDNVAWDSSFVPLEMLAKADMKRFSLSYDESLMILDTIVKSFPDHPVLDEAFFRRAEIYVIKKEYLLAIEELKVILSRFYLDILADNALFLLGDIYDRRLGDRELAMKYFLQLITDFPGSILASEARQRYRALRGDQLNQ